MSVKDFKEAAKNDELVDTILRRYTHALLMQIAVSGGCNSLHSVQERYARWLLMMHGRTNVEVFAFTQEFLSRMLGVSRARVNIVTGALEKAGLISTVATRSPGLVLRDLKRLPAIAIRSSKRNLREYCCRRTSHGTQTNARRLILRRSSAKWAAAKRF